MLVTRKKIDSKTAIFWTKEKRIANLIVFMQLLIVFAMYLLHKCNINFNFVLIKQN